MSAPLTIELRRLTDARHRLTVTRADGSTESSDLETRSVLLHDLVHLAVEAEAGLGRAFWGRVAAGASFGELLAEAESATDGELWLAEALLGPMQSVWNERMTVDAYVEGARDVALPGAAPRVDAAFVNRVLERLRRLVGAWRGTPFHESLVLRWPLDPGA